MKKLTVKSIAFGILFVMGSLLVHAQQGNPIWTTSKDVQKIANKSLFSDQNLKNSHINAVSLGYPEVALSKGVTKINYRGKAQEKQGGNVVSKGYPMWTVSKAVQIYSNKH